MLDLLSGEVKKLAIEKGWHRSKSSVFGFESGFVVNLYSVTGNKVFQISLQNETDEQVKAVEEEFKRNSGGFKNITFKVENKTLAVTMAEVLTSRKKGEMLKILDFVLNTINSKGISGPNKCSECGISEDTDFYYFEQGNIGIKLCRGCVHKINTRIEDVRIELKETKGNYVNGALGSLIYGSAGALCVVLFGFLGKVAAASGVVSILLGAKGYAKFGGKADSIDKWIILGTSVLNMILGNVLFMAAIIFKKTGNLKQIIPILTRNTKVQELLLRETMLTLVFCLIYFSYWFWMRNKATKLPVLLKAEKVAI